MTPEYEIVRYRPEHRASVLELVKELWGPDPLRNAACFEWKYEQNPYLSDVLIYLATYRGEPVAMRGFIGSRWEAGLPPREATVLCAEDLVTAPEHRNRGLFRLITETAFADLATQFQGVVLSLSAGIIAQLGSLTMGWKSITPMEPLELLSPAYRRRKRWLGRLGRMKWLRRLVEPSARFDGLDAKASRPPAGLRLERVPDPDAMASLIQRLHYDGRTRHRRDARYFGWRFRNPLREYRFLYAGSPLLGYLVLHRPLSFPGAFRPIQISDVEATSLEVYRTLVETALEHGRFPAVEAWGAALPAEARALLTEKGFRPVDRAHTNRSSRRALVRPLRNPADPAQWTLLERSVLEPGSWDFRMLYSVLG